MFSVHEFLNDYYLKILFQITIYKLQTNFALYLGNSFL